MGLLTNDVRALVDLYSRGASFRAVAMLGRQWLMCPREELRQILLGAGVSGETVRRLVNEDLTFADPLFKALGAETVDAVDYSDFEGASIIHDLNTPLPDDLKCRFDLVVDGGTIEHVFNVPEALRTCISLVKPGGHVFLTNPANNLCGHGFYQFSPELMFRVFSPENGFNDCRVLLSEVFPRSAWRSGAWRDVRDPKTLGYRAAVDAGVSMHLITTARRAVVVPLFTRSPLQSDYAAEWEESKEAGARRMRGNRVSYKKRVVYAADALFPRLMAAVRTLRNPLRSDEFYGTSAGGQAGAG